MYVNLPKDDIDGLKRFEISFSYQLIFLLDEVFEQRKFEPRPENKLSGFKKYTFFKGPKSKNLMLLKNYNHKTR